ncbi:MAG: RAMP superfamily CRISPR-associated protein [Neomegalonema sp.]|nr:RAMP superfamily CRISPR-associated protein [Neomegalonema sp.]
MSETELPITITFESDWMIGTGSGRQGSVDRLIARDDSGLPYVPASSLRGVWRDAAEKLAQALDGTQALDDTQADTWAALVEHLFGSQPGLVKGESAHAPSPAHLSVGDARYSEALRSAVLGSEFAALRQAFTLVKPGVAIDPFSGTAKPDHLRFEEVARKGAVLEARAELSGPLATDETTRAFLVAAAKLITGIGGSRHRGSGKCRVVVGGKLTLSGAVAELQETAAAPAIATTSDENSPPLPSFESANDESRSDPPSDKSSSESNGGAYSEFDLTITLEQPLLIASEIRGNVTLCHEHIPGQVLLPMVLRAMKGDIPAALAANQISVGPAFIAEPDGETACLPVPMCWERKKDDTAGPDGKGALRNRFADEGAVGQWKPMRSGYMALSESKLHFAEPKKSLRTLNVIDDEKSRPTSEIGGLYAYEALEAGQVFISRIRVATDILGSDPEAFARDFRRADCLGRSRSSGYGRVALELSLVSDDKKDVAGTASNLLTIYCASDLLLQDSYLCSGAPVAMLRSALAAALGAGVEIKDHALRMRRIESWQSSWGLPRPSLIALQAGSCATFEVLDGKTDALKALQESGIGERRVEGFGQVIFNKDWVRKALNGDEGLLHRCEKWKEEEDRASNRSTDGARYDLKKEEQNHLERIEEELFLRAVRRQAERIAAKPDAGLGFTKTQPPMSQLGAMRSAMGRLESDDEVDALYDLLRGISEHRRRGAKWPEATVDALLKILGHPEEEGSTAPAGAITEQIWSKLPESEEDPWPALRAGRCEALKQDPQIRRAALFALLHAAMRGHKRRLEVGNGGMHPQQQEAANGA